MENIGSRQKNHFRGSRTIWEFIIPILYGVVGAAFYLIFSLLSFAYFQPSIANVTFRPATVILVLFGVLYGPWTGLLAGVAGKTVSDLFAGWGFYWNGTLAYGLIGFLSGFIKPMKDLKSVANILRAVLWGGLGIFVGALFMSLTEVLFGKINLKVAIFDYFWPELTGNLTVVIVLLPLLMFAIGTSRRNK